MNEIAFQHESQPSIQYNQDEMTKKSSSTKRGGWRLYVPLPPHLRCLIMDFDEQGL